MKYTPSFMHCNEENLKLFKSQEHYKQKLATLRIAMIATGIYTIDQTEDIIKLLTRLQLSLKIKSFKPIDNNNYEILSWTNNLKEEISLTVNDILLLKGFTITDKNFNTNDAFYSFFINEMFAEAAAYCIKYKAHIKEIIENISSTYSDIEIVDIDGECCVRLYFNHRFVNEETPCVGEYIYMPKAFFVKFIHPKPVPYSALENRKAVQHTLQVLMKNTIKSNDCDKLFMGDFFKNLPYNLYDLNKLSKDITDYNEEHYKIKFTPNEIQLRASLYLLWLKKKERVFKTEYGFYLLQADFQQKFIELYKLVYKKHRCEVLYISDNTIYDLYDNFNINNY